MNHSENRPLRVGVHYLAVFLATASVLFLVGCSDSGNKVSEAPLDPSAQAIQELLELRVERSADASAYAEYLLSPDVAQELADSDVMSADATTAPIPQWEEPYVLASDEGSASVVVIWIRDDQYSDWPVANVFLMQKSEGMWKAGDVEVIAESEDIPSPEQ